MSRDIKKLQARTEDFSRLMAIELLANEHKGDWQQCDPKLLLMDCMYHGAKLASAIKEDNPDKVKEYAADVANMAMMVLDAYKTQRDGSIAVERSKDFNNYEIS